MPVMQPASPRSTIEDTEPALIITIPTHKDWLLITMMLFWLVSWACGELMAGMGVVFLFGGLLGWASNSADASAAGAAAFAWMALFSILWFLIWTLGGLVALYFLLWQFTGAERIEVNAQGITLRRLTLNMGRPRVYLAEHIKDLRTVTNSPYSWWWWSSRMYYWQWMFGAITFDYGSKTICCGNGVDEAEAKAIVRTIQGRFPQYQTQ